MLSGLRNRLGFCIFVKHLFQLLLIVMPYFAVHLRNEDTGVYYDTIDAYEMECKDKHIVFKDAQQKTVAIIPLDVICLIKKVEKKD